MNDYHNLDAIDRIEKICEKYGDKIVLLSSMQRTSSVLMHMFYRLGIRTEILFVDTGYHFPETLQVRDQYIRRYDLNIITLYPNITTERQELESGEKLYKSIDGQKLCCDLRKTQPFLEYMKQNHKKYVITGACMDGQRKDVKFFTGDPRINGCCVQPIFDWDSERVSRYLDEYNVLVHPLHSRNYPSIGCGCCTTPVSEGEDKRAGRWRHLKECGHKPEYCGLNYFDKDLCSTSEINRTNIMNKIIKPPKSKFGHYAIDEQDWDVIVEFMRKRNIKSVVEFGVGLSTELFKQACDSVLSYEHDSRYAKGQVIMYEPLKDIDPIKHNGQIVRYDMAFVDGPNGRFRGPDNCSRYHTTKAAMKYSDIIMIHDAVRDGETETARRLLSDWDRTDFSTPRGLAVFERRK